MKFALALLVGLLVGFTPLVYTLPFLSDQSDKTRPADNSLLRSLIHSPFEPSSPRPLVREDLIETLASEEEEDDLPEAEVGGIASLLSLDRHRMQLLGLTSSPWRRESGTLRQPPTSQLRC